MIPKEDRCTPHVHIVICFVLMVRGNLVEYTEELNEVNSLSLLIRNIYVDLRTYAIRKGLVRSTQTSGYFVLIPQYVYYNLAFCNKSYNKSGILWQINHFLFL